MEVLLIAETGIPNFDDVDIIMEIEDCSPEEVVEFAGRTCYDSYHRPNPATAATGDYVKSIIEKRHESVLEHAQATFRVSGVSRNLTHELVRHRHLSYSQESQRFVDYSTKRLVEHPGTWGLSDEVGVRLADVFAEAEETGQELYRRALGILDETGLGRKQKREIARMVIPGGVETVIVVSGNFRAWRDFLWKRLDKAADAEIRLLAQKIWDELMEVAPSVFEDMTSYRMTGVPPWES